MDDRSGFRLRFLGGAILLAACLALPAGAGLRTNTQTYADSTGEDAAAPDVTSVVVSNDDSGLVTFQINISNRPALTSDMAISLFLDTDANVATGDPAGPVGVDYGVVVVSGPGALGKWNGTDFDFGTPQSTFSYSYAPTGVMIKVNTSDLGGTAHFAFVFAVISGLVLSPTPDSSNAHSDVGPDIGPLPPTYDVKVTPPQR